MNRMNPRRRMRALALSAIATLAPAVPAARAADAAAAPEGAISERVEGAVVKVFATTRRPDLARPWTRQTPAEVTGSGVVIEGHRILTNAHVVAYAGQVQVQADREGDKHLAHVVAISHGMDLAVLALDDESFFERHAPLERTTRLPRIKDAVLAYGFPMGGSSLSITKGIVSRIEFTDYHANATGLRVQIDAAINPGNSGGPATVGDRMIGLSFATLGGAQNIGYIIPNEEIEIFLRGVAAGSAGAKPTLHDELQTLENPSLRAFLRLPAGVHGVVVHRPLGDGPDYPLKEWDVITAIAGVPVDDEGMVLVEGSLRLGLRYEIQHAARDGRIALDIVRDGRPMRVEVAVPAERPALLHYLAGGYPSYFIYGPIVFSRATLDSVAALNAHASAVNIASSPLVTQIFDAPGAERDELVIIPAPLFPHPLSQGYGGVVGSVVSTVNGVRVRSLRHLVALLRDLQDEYLVVEFDSKRAGESIVLRRSEVLAATEEILSDNGVRAQGSPDMLQVWNAPRASSMPTPGVSSPSGSPTP